MDRRLILLVAGLGAAALGLLSLLLPGATARLYVSVMHPLALFLGFILAFQVASIYERELKLSFVFLALFLLLYMLGNILALWRFLYSLLGNTTTFVVLLLQVVDYALLLISCVYTLRVIEVKRMSWLGWIFLGLLLSLCVYIVAYGVPSLTRALPSRPAVAVVGMMIRVFDMLVVLMLVPVLFLYLQHLRTKAQESITFTFIMGGIMLSLISTYIFQLVLGMPLEQIAAAYFQKGSLLDATYLFGYLIVAVGLYAHRKYDEWGFQMIEKALSAG